MKHMKFAILSYCHVCLLPAPWKWGVCPVSDCSGRGIHVPRVCWETWTWYRLSECSIIALWCYALLPCLPKSVSTHFIKQYNYHSSECGCFTKCSLKFHINCSNLYFTRTEMKLKKICSGFSRIMSLIT